MSSDTDIQRAYSRVTDDASSGPDLAQVLARGRGARRRRTRLRVAGVAGAVAVVVAAGVAAPRLGGSTEVVAPAAPPAATDHVEGTDVDDTMVSAVAAHLPQLEQPRDVFPSDTHHNGPMPDEDFATATDWQAEYDVDGGGFFRLLLAHADKPYVPLCDDCLRTAVPGGRIGTDWSRSYAETDADHPWTFRVVFQGDDGRVAIATEKVAGATLRSARQARTFTDAELAELVQDGSLTFPEPVG
ncbi:hypothetical protein H5V45_02910 [Nocardioides sp. KIGAM211]|uniref:Uncharacterized protein n=1 Tax=Nocardioides luti TaxID=2761101 RepID=A0A7X0V940_9ACTN|nr:hypothetical protein [Nocardioides luti]MBB6626264.1 hypothetical protein [Nocardioides luti]